MNRRKVGTAFEEAACRYFERLGCRVLARNFRCRRAEIDLVVLDQDVLVFIEVKYRRNARNGIGAEAVDRWKQRRIAGCADYFLLKHPEFREMACRFDVLSIDREHMVHYKDAFWRS